MSSVLIVEDELIVARDIQNRLTRLGYRVVGVTAFGEEAIELAGEHRPNLVLMDIRLRGAIDGVTAAEAIRTRYGLAVVYLTAYADEDTLARARATEPCGYILKPFEERELRTVVEMALYKHEAEHRLRESEKRYRKLVETVRDILFTTSSDGVITSLSPAFESISGWPCSAWVGRHFASLLHSEDLPLALDVFHRVMEGESTPLFETRIITSAGGYATVEWKATPLLDETGKTVVGCTGISRDVTERKQLEQQFAHAQKMEAIGQLAGGVAHDFNNIMTGIIGYTDLLLLRLYPGHPLFADLEAIKKAAWLAASLTRQLLTFSRKQVRQPVPLHVGQVVAGTEKMLRSLLGEHIELVTALGDGLPQVKADHGQLEHIIMNLALNARDAMPRGGTLTIRTGVSAGGEWGGSEQPAPAAEYVHLTIGDTGCGMSEEVKSHLFEPFFTTKEVGKGTGLGLSSVYGIVKQSGGHIEVTSEVGRGTTFHIWLPSWAGALRSQVLAEGDHLLPGNGTVLLVEDEEVVRIPALRALRECGYTVLEAHQPGEAVRISQQHAGPIDLLLLDVVMPGMSGPELARHLKLQRPQSKVLFMSGYAATPVLERETLDTQLRFLAKPFTPATLTRKVAEILGHSPPRGEDAF